MFILLSSIQWKWMVSRSLKGQKKPHKSIINAVHSINNSLSKPQNSVAWLTECSASCYFLKILLDSHCHHLLSLFETNQFGHSAIQFSVAYIYIYIYTEERNCLKTWGWVDDRLSILCELSILMYLRMWHLNCVKVHHCDRKECGLYDCFKNI